MKCEKCGTEFEGNYCPNGCNMPQPTAMITKPKKPITKRWWFWALIIFFGIGFISGIGNSIAPDEDTEPTSQEQTNTETKDDDSTLNSEPEPTPEPEKDPAQIKADYIAGCESIAYTDIARYPDNYKGKKVKFRGEVVQVSEALFGSKNTYLIAVTENEYGYWDDSVYVQYSVPKEGPNVLEDDIVTFYGECTGTTSYKAVLGNKITIPSVEAKYIDIE